MDVRDDLIPLLGRPPEKATAERLAALFPGLRDDYSSGPLIIWEWKSAGIAIHFQDGILDDIQLRGIPFGGYARFAACLPGGLAVDACRREVRAALGSPDEQGVPEPFWCDAADHYHDDTEPHIIGYSYHSDRYKHPGYELLFTYDWDGDATNGRHVGRDLWAGDVDGLRATVVHLWRPGAKPSSERLERD
jgi:hypothetical protein